jgi:3-oxoacyl-[acyl-carrier protein] reductase
LNVDGKIAIVTGAGQGIGRTIALSLAERGASVVVADINMDLAGAVAVEVEALRCSAMPWKVNVASLKDCEDLMKAVIDRFGKIDILVNNAGITRDMVLLRMKEEQWDDVISVNLKGTFNCTKTAIRYMFRQKSGCIINIASVTGAMGNPGQANYSASKAGIMGFTKAVAREYAEYGITVNAVAPGFIATAMTDAIPQKDRDLLIAQIPAKRLGTPEDVAAVVCFLASNASSYITGQVIHTNGGLYM